MRKFYKGLVFETLIPVFCFFLLISNCAPKKESTQLDPETAFLLVVANPANCASGSCSCTVSSSNVCFDWSQTSLAIATARSACTSLAGAISLSSGCSTTSVVGTCSGLLSRTSSQTQVSYYDFFTSTSFSSSHSDNTSRCSDFGSSMTYVKSTRVPRVRFINNSGGAENYTLHTSAACGGGTLAATIGAVANNATSAYFTVPEGNFAVSFDGGTNCSALILNIGNGMVRTITSTSVYSIAATTE